MTSSFQSTAFQPAASPVDTFVAEPSVLPKTNAEELAGILSSVNPALQNYFGAEINEKKQEQEQLGMEKVMQASKPELQRIINQVKKQDGSKAARQLVGGNMFFRAGVEKQLAITLGGIAETKAKTFFNNYTVKKQLNDGTIINVPLEQYSVESPEFQTALGEYSSTQQSDVSGIRSLYVNKYFLPQQNQAIQKIHLSHQEAHNEYNVQNAENKISDTLKSTFYKIDENQELIENCINEFRFWISQERQLPTYSSTQRSSLSYDKSFSNIYGKFMPNDFFKLDSVYNQKGKYSNNHINKAKKHIEQFINFIHLNPESTKTFERMFHVARRHYLEKHIRNKNLDISNVTEDDLLLGEEARFWELLLIFVHTKSSILSRTFMQDICGTLIRAILFIEGIYAYGQKIEEDLSSNLYSMVVAELDFILPVFDAHIEAMCNQIYRSDEYTLNIPIGYKFFSWQFREAVLDLRNFISAMEDINIYDLPKPSYHKSKNPSFEQVLLLSKNKREVYLKNIRDLRNYIDKRKCKNKNKSEKKDYQRYAQIRNAGLKADDQGKINRKEAKKWLKSRSGRRKLNELYIDNKLDYLIGYIDFEEMCS